jgi:multidrug transporter EmrE-like cation transporter
MNPVIIVIGCQILFTTGDLLARAKMRHLGFHPQSFLSWWFVGYVTLRTFATFGQLWVLSKVSLGRGLPMFSAISVVLTMVLSVTVLREGLSVRTVVGGGLAVAALVTLAIAG